MPPVETRLTIPAELQAELRQALADLMKGVRDLEAAKRACERMDQLREENRRLFGEQNCAVDIIRKTREAQ